jgi:glucose/arabinose dehydrogenase
VPRRLFGVSLVAVLVGCGGGDPAGARTDASPVPRVQESPAQTAATPPKLVRIGSFDSPVHVTAPPGDTRRVFVTEQAGRIMVVRDGRKLATPFLDIRPLVTSGGEQGLLSLAFAPDYAQSRRFYVYYTDRRTDQRIVEYRATSADRADASSARLVLRMPDDESNHNGGLLLFGPDDLLYIGTGDGGGGGDLHGRRGNAQNLGSLLGKILRIDPRPSGSQPYSIPASNPFRDGDGARGEIYAYGLRNPWRFSFDRETGDLTIGDVGQNAIEEIDFVRRGGGRGANFGWRVFEGRSRYTSGETAPGAIAPVIQTTHADGNCSITGGVVVRDPALKSLYGRYVFGDICKPRILSARLARPRARDLRKTALRVPSVSSFGEDARGRVYAASLNGPVFRLAAR